MGIVCCQKHGLTGISFACEHVASAVANGLTIKSVALRTNCIFGELTILCQDCHAEVQRRFPDSAQLNHALEQSWDHELDVATDAFLNSLYRPVCGRCFQDYRQENPPSPHNSKK